MIDKPNYTQTPNILFDEVFKQMKFAELQVTLAIVRQTFGYHRPSAQLSLSDLEELTGMSRESVSNGLKAGMRRGTITRERSSEGYLYRLVVGETDQSTKTTSQLTRPEVVNLPDQGSQLTRPEVVNLPDQNTPVLKKDLKKRSKERSKEREGIPPAPPNRQRQRKKPDEGPPKTPTPHQAMFGAICDAIGWDPKAISETDKANIGKVAAAFLKAGYTADDIPRFMVEVWFKDWRWSRDQARPTLNQLRQAIGKLRTNTLPVEPPYQRGNHHATRTHNSDTDTNGWQPYAEDEIIDTVTGPGRSSHAGP